MKNSEQISFLQMKFPKIDFSKILNSCQGHIHDDTIQRIINFFSGYCVNDTIVNFLYGNKRTDKSKIETKITVASSKNFRKFVVVRTSDTYHDYYMYVSTTLRNEKSIPFYLMPYNRYSKYGKRINNSNSFYTFSDLDALYTAIEYYLNDE